MPSEQVMPEEQAVSPAGAATAGAAVAAASVAGSDENEF
jgi:hypothetical protein